MTGMFETLLVRTGTATCHITKPTVNGAKISEYFRGAEILESIRSKPAREIAKNKEPKEVTSVLLLAPLARHELTGTVEVKFYETLGLTLINKMEIEEAGLTLHYVAYDGPGAPCTGRHWTDRSGVIELTYSHGSENEPNFSLANGNTEPHLGFGHVVSLVDNLEGACRKFEDAGLTIDEGPSKALVFMTDPDGYKIGISEPGKGNAQQDATDPASYRMSHTMLRIKDPHRSLNFYHEVLGMSLLRTVEHDQAGLTLYYLGYTGATPSMTAEATSLTADSEGLVELMWIHGTENREGRVYHDGNSDPLGFGHLCIGVDDIDAACERFEKLNKSWEKRLNGTSMNDMAFMLDPDGYWIEILQNEAIKPRAHW
ncbi:MAG: Lactoylglutathione lyase [Icmadophila ericetorum]|nr:Lactoylglutathione lyase [Icmadophila ericetorum]